jgi:hypothetical protein
MQRDILRAQARALMAMCEALLAELDEPDSCPDDPAPGMSGCEHPEAFRVSARTYGGPPSFYCRLCEQTIEGVVKGDEDHAWNRQVTENR